MNEHEANRPVTGATPAPNPFTKGDRALFEHAEVTYDVLAVDGQDVWCQHPSGRRVTIPARQLTLVPDTVTVELPRVTAEKWAGSKVRHGADAIAVGEACRKALGR